MPTSKGSTRTSGRKSSSKRSRRRHASGNDRVPSVHVRNGWINATGPLGCVRPSLSREYALVLLEASNVADEQDQGKRALGVTLFWDSANSCIKKLNDDGQDVI